MTLAAALVVLLLLGGSGSRTLTGTITVASQSVDDEGRCWPETGYDDVDEGAQVAISGDSGEVLGLGELSPGAFLQDGYQHSCEFAFEIADLPDSDFYTVEIGNDSRGGLHYSAAELRNQDWNVALSLGD